MLYVTWWLGLGVLSSIGLGTGMHSGLLFLFPHMLKVRAVGGAAAAVGVLPHRRTVANKLACITRSNCLWQIDELSPLAV
jgi:hypothetical protein